MVTKAGVIKRTALANYSNIRKNGLIAINLNEGDSLAWTRITSGEDELIVATRNGMATASVRTTPVRWAAPATGVRAIRLKEGDSVWAWVLYARAQRYSPLRKKAKGGATDVRDYRTQYRGGLGIRNYGAKATSRGLRSSTTPTISFSSAWRASSSACMWRISTCRAAMVRVCA